MMKPLLFPLLLLALLAPAALAEKTETAEVAAPDPIEILKQADAAAKKVEAVRYRAASTPTGIATNFISAAEGEGVLAGWNADYNMPGRFYARVETTPVGSDQKMALTGGGNGDTFFLINHQEKKAYEDIDPAVLGSTGQIVGAFGMRELVHPTPFEDEIGAEKIEYQGTEKVGDVECHKIHVTYSGGQGESTWLIAKDDHLPRKRIQHFDIPGQGAGTFEITLTELEIAPEIDPELFRLDLPEGYAQIDDFAP